MSIKSFISGVGAICLSFFFISSAHAALIGNATSINGGTLYEGLGETSPGNGVGSGRWQIGDCTFDGTSTICVLSGTYEEAADSTVSPGATGSYTMTYEYLGTLNPGIAQSIAPGSDFLSFAALGDALFTLEVIPMGGSAITTTFPADPFENSFGFAVEHDGATQVCNNLPTQFACTIANVGLNAGSSLSATAFNSFSFSIPDSVLNTSEVPLPAALPLFLAGIAGFSATARRRKRA